MAENHRSQLSVPVDAELKARLEAAASRYGDRSVASYVREIVIRALNEKRDEAAA
jgi:predicted DNA-binding protein